MYGSPGTNTVPETLENETAAASYYAVNTTSFPAEASTRVIHEAVFRAGTMYGTSLLAQVLLTARGEMEVFMVADKGSYRDPNNAIGTLHEEAVDMFSYTYGESAVPRM
jgi:hypothetical protein